MILDKRLPSRLVRRAESGTLVALRDRRSRVGTVKHSGARLNDNSSRQARNEASRPMKFHVVSGKAALPSSDCAVVGVYEGGALSSSARELDRPLGGRITALVARGDFAGKLGDALLLTDLPQGAPPRAVLVGLGGKAAFGRRTLRKKRS